MNWILDFCFVLFSRKVFFSKIGNKFVIKNELDKVTAEKKIKINSLVVKYLDIFTPHTHTSIN